MHRTVRTALAAVLFAFLAASAAMAAEAPVLSPGVVQAMSDPAFAGRNVDGTVAVWVWFTDKGLAGAELERALDRAESRLDAHARARRAKMRTDKSARLVDVTRPAGVRGAPRVGDRPPAPGCAACPAGWTRRAATRRRNRPRRSRRCRSCAR